jgi:hypothetical protein
VHRLEARITRFPAVRIVPTGSVVYCPEIPFGWIDVPVSASDPVNNSGAWWCNFKHGLTAGLTITADNKIP